MQATKSRWMLAGVLLLAALVRLAPIGAEEIWLDEAYTVEVARASPGDVLKQLARDNKPPLYFLLLHGWIGILGDGVVAIRALSALFGILFVSAIWSFGPALVGDRAGRLAALLAALHPLAVHYGQESRDYALLLVLLTIAMLAQERARKEDRRWWIVHSLAWAGALLTNYIVALLLPVSALQAVTSQPRTWRRWFGATFAALLPLLLLLPWAGSQADHAKRTISWLQPYWSDYAPFEAVAMSLRTLLPAGPAPAWIALETARWIQPLVILTGLIAFAAFLRSGEPGSHAARRMKMIIVAGLIVPLVALELISRMGTPIYIVGRADLVSLPSMLLLLGVGASSGRWRRSIATCVIALSVIGLGWDLAHPRRGLEAHALHRVARRVGNGDLVVTTGLALPTARYHLRRLGVEPDYVTFPLELIEHPAWIDRGSDPMKAPLEADADAAAERIRATLERGRRVVLLLTDDRVNSVLVASLHAYRLRRVDAYQLNRPSHEVEVVTVERAR